MRKAIYVLGVFGALALMLKAWTCGPFIQQNYLDGYEEFILALPKTLFYYNVDHVINPNSKVYAFEDVFNDADTDARISEIREDIPSPDRTKSWERTLHADLVDLREALANSGKSEVTAAPLIARYETMRRGMKPAPDPDYFYVEPSIYSTTSKRVDPIDLIAYEDILSQIPQEFALYAKGAAYYRSGQMERAKVLWQELLNLPPEQRSYRTTWTAYMMGKASLVQEATHQLDSFNIPIRSFLLKPFEAVEYFQKTQQYAKEGFKDTLNLAQDSLGWLAHAEMIGGYYREAIHHYLELYPQDPSETRQSLNMLCARVFHGNAIDESMLQDDMCRKILTAWVMSRKTVNLQDWITRVEQAKPDLAGEEADQLAWLSYKSGNFDQAKAWLAKSATHTPEGKWVESRLLFRDGKVDEAVQVLKELVPLFGPGANVDVLGSLGVIHLGRQEYVEAMDAFLRAGLWTDTAYLAEYVVHGQDLEKYVQQYKGDSVSELRDILARKLARERQWKKALEYQTDNKKETLQKYVNALILAENPKKSKAERAANYAVAAEIAGQFGMELMGTETDPDWFWWDGNLDLLGPLETRNPSLRNLDQMNEWHQEVAKGNDSQVEKQPPEWRKYFTAGTDEAARAKANLPTPYKRFHYRYTAADLYWKCAQLQSDNDPKLAEALYMGGMLIAKRDPQAADKFYKALVRRCKKLAIGKEADRLHWFPDTVTSFESTE